MSIFGKLSQLISRRSAPSTVGLPSGMLNLASLQSSSGIAVTETNALSAAAVFAAIRNTSEDVAKLPIHVVRELPDGGRVRQSGHPVQRVLNNPNPEMTRMDLIQALVGSAWIWGTGYAQIRKLNSGRIFEIWPIESYRVQPWRDSNKNLYYHVYPGTTYPIGPRPNEVTTLRPEEIFCLKSFNVNGLLGLRTILLGKESIGLTLAMQNYAASLFGNGARPGGIITYPKVLSADAAKNLKASWEAAHGGTGKQHGTAVLEDGAKWEKVAGTPEESQMLESRAFQIEEVCRWFRIPPQKLQHLVKTAFNSAEQFDIEYAKDTIGPWLSRIEQEGKKKLLDEDDYCLDIDESELIRGDTLSRFDAEGKLHLAGLSTRNEGRVRAGLNPVAGGDVFLLPKNSVPVGRDDSVEEQQEAIAGTAAEAPAPAEEEVTPPPAPEPVPTDDEDDDQEERQQTLKRLAEAHRPVLVDAVKRLLRVEGDKVTRAAKKEGFPAWCDEFYRGHAAHVRSALSPALTAFSESAYAVMGSDPSQQARDLLVQRRNGLVEKYLSDSRSDLSEVDGLEQRVGGWAEHRADAFVQSALDELVEAVRHGNSSGN